MILEAGPIEEDLATLERKYEAILSDADAMMEQLRLSNFPQVELVARVSRSGNATAGEWIGRSGAVSSTEDRLQSLRIDQPEKR